MNVSRKLPSCFDDPSSTRPQSIAPPAESSTVPVRIKSSISALFLGATAVLGLLGVLAGCGATGPKIPKSALPRLVLQPADLGPGYVRFDAGPLTIADTQTGPREDLHRAGRAGGWKARYKRRRRGMPGPVSVSSFADLFDSTGRASKDLGAYKLEFEEAGVEGQEVFVHVPKIGSDTLATTVVSGPIRDYRLAWRYGNATASVEVEGFDGKVSKHDAVALARRQQRRIVRAAR